VNGKDKWKKKEKKKNSFERDHENRRSEEPAWFFQRNFLYPIFLPIYDLTRWNSCPKRKKHKNK
jgi:hypothetical protein